MLYLFARLNEFIYGDHPIFIPVHFLKWKYNNQTFIWLTASLFSPKQYWCHQYFSAFKQSLNEGERKHGFVWPGRSSPHVLLGHRPAWWGTCISPSCHRWTSWCPASPVKCIEKQRKQYWEFPIKIYLFFIVWWKMSLINILPEISTYLQNIDNE